MLILSRLTESKTETIGVYSLDNKIISLCLELPYRENLENISCIPCGEYDIVKEKDDKHGEYFRILNVPDREGVLIHTGGWWKHTLGCQMPGLNLGEYEGYQAIFDSRKAMNELYKLLPDKSKLLIEKKYI